VEIFGKISANYNLKVPENLKLKDLNTIKKLVAYMETKVDSALIAPVVIPTSAPVSTPEPVAAPTAPAVSPAASLASDIKAVISAQTGYEVDMLEDDLDLEADLGIDTVKQVEIFGKISANYNLKVPENLKLKDLNTIRKLVVYMESRIDIPKKPAVDLSDIPRINVKPSVSEEFRPSSGVKRFTASAIRQDLTHEKANPFKNACILVTRDSHGFADRLCQSIAAMGGKTVTLGKHSNADIRADLTKPDTVESVAAKIMALSPPITGLIHLAPLDVCFETRKAFDLFGKKETPEDKINMALKSLFILIKHLKDRLNQKGSLIAAMGVNSVVFPYLKGFKGTIHPEFAAVAGLLKTVNKEYLDTIVRMVDFNLDFNQGKIGQPGRHVDSMVKTFMDELCSTETRVETGYQGQDRYVLSLDATEIIKTASIIKPNDTILVTGGAMGITYEILKKTAETYRANLIILGRSRISDIDPAYLLPGTDPSVIMSRVKASMPGTKPLDIKKTVDRIMRTREAALNIKRLELAGIKVQYESVDVTDAHAVAHVISKHKTISGIIHAAGIEESQFIEKKDPASFNRVADVKIKGLANILNAMKKRDYRYVITFSSVTARFGNEGQADYTAANDMIGKMLMKEKLENPGKHYKIYAWTAWSGAGMAENETVKKVLSSRGITFLPLDEGIRFFLADLENTADTEVVITGADRAADTDAILAAIPGDLGVTPAATGDSRFPFLDLNLEKNKGKATYSRTLTLERDLFLLDHSMDGTPIFLGATGIETMAEAACSLDGNAAHLVEVRDFSIPYGIKILKGRPKDITIDTENAGPSDENAYTCKITSVFKNPKGQIIGDPTLHYQGLVVVGNTLSPETTVTLPTFTKPVYQGDADSLIYHPQRLFMDDIFKTLKDVVSFDGELMITQFKDDSTRPFFAGDPTPNFVSDVVAVDAMFQTGGLLEFFTTNNLVLPYKINRMTVHRRVVKGDSYYCLTRKTADSKETNTYQLDLVDKNGNLFIRIQDFQMVKLSTLDPQYRITDRLKQN
jgi:NAD(P)-dependent dehydrogenase (short-subunit alcohol dehydrogenase family)/acyl carrier protein